ncbi:MAG TPA: NADP-dependent oxidoreductase [Prolixibacteraceae bacterium]|nr:NADP-dependent oxidoreductase [Prolixibacteraceae bacterium]
MNKQIVLKKRPIGVPTVLNFEVNEVPIPTIEEGELLLKSKVVSVDPYMRGRMSDAKSYVAPFEIGKPIAGGIVAEVVESKHPDFKAGDDVIGSFPWQEVFTAKGSEASKVDGSIAPLSYYLGILGMPGLTAYFGLLDIGKPQKGETVVVSGAAGAVGIVVGQIAKIHGCRVVGIAGDQKKIDYLVNELGFDAAINYKTEVNIAGALAAACPDGVDVYFDNVGGEISDAVISQINKGARIIICGQISLYNATSQPVGPRIQPTILKKSALMQGFIVSNYASRFPEGFKALAGWVGNGQLKYTNTTYHGFEKLPEAFIALFEGKNLGKLIVETSL